jgi:hypothetical protein
MMRIRRQRGPVTPLEQAQRPPWETLLRRPLARLRIRKRGRFAETGRLAKDVDATLAASGASGTDAPAQRVLVVQLKEGPVLAAYSAVFAQALRLRGAEVAFLTCGGGQPICEVGWGRRTYPYPCDRCSFFTDTWAKAQGIRTYRLRDGFPWGRNAARAPMDPDAARSGAPLDEDEVTSTSVPRFFLAGNYQDLPHAEDVTRDFTVAAHGVYTAVDPVLDEFKPTTILVNNGLTTSENAVVQAAEARGIRVVTYCAGFPPGTLMFSDGEPAIKHDSSGAWQALRDRPLTAEQLGLIRAYMDGRFAGQGTFAGLYDSPLSERLREELDVAGYDRVATLFTNIAWDTATLGRDVGFSSMQSCVVEAVEAAREHPRTALVVRVHPYEHAWGSAEPLEELLAEAFPELPPNVRIVGHDRSINSYALMDASDVVLTYTSTTGLEAALRGRPVAVCGAAHYRGKGFTIDVAGPDDLRRQLAGTKAFEPQVELAWRYAFMFCFQMCIPVRAVTEPTPDVLGPLPTRAAELAPGRDPYLDFICERTLHGGSFVLPAELAAAPARTADDESILVPA